MSERRQLLSRRDQVTQKVRIGGKRVLYVSVHADDQGRSTASDQTALRCAPVSRLLRIYIQAVSHGSERRTLPTILGTDEAVGDRF